MLLAGKTIVVTGGNSGIGEAIVTAAATAGANVVIDYIVHPEETSGHCCIEPKDVIVTVQTNKAGSTILWRTMTNRASEPCCRASGGQMRRDRVG